jgi:hypothetical protein
MKANSKAPLLAVCIEIDTSQSEEILIHNPDELDSKLEHFFTVNNIANFALRANIRSRIAGSLALLIIQGAQDKAIQTHMENLEGRERKATPHSVQPSRSPSVREVRGKKEIQVKGITSLNSIFPKPPGVTKPLHKLRNANKIAKPSSMVTRSGLNLKFQKNANQSVTNSIGDLRLTKGKKFSIPTAISNNLRQLTQNSDVNLAAKMTNSKPHFGHIGQITNPTFAKPIVETKDNQGNSMKTFSQTVDATYPTHKSTQFENSPNMETTLTEICTCGKKSNGNPSISENLPSNKIHTSSSTIQIEKSKFCARSVTRLPEYENWGDSQQDGQRLSAYQNPYCQHSLPKPNQDNGSHMSESFVKKSHNYSQPPQNMQSSWAHQRAEFSGKGKQVFRHNSICIQPDSISQSKLLWQIEKAKDDLFKDRHFEVADTEVNSTQISRAPTKANSSREIKEPIKSHDHRDCKENRHRSNFAIQHSDHGSVGQKHQRVDSENLEDVRRLFGILDQDKSGMISRTNFNLRGLNASELKALEPLILQVYQEAGGFCVDLKGFLSMYRKFVPS